MGYRQLDSLSIQIVASYFKRMKDIRKYKAVNKKYEKSVERSKYPSMISYCEGFKEIFPMVTTVIVTTQTIRKMGKMIWEERMEGITGIELVIDEDTPEEGIVIRPERFGMIQGITIRNRRTTNVHLLLNEIMMLQNLRRLEIDSELVMEKDVNCKRSEDEIIELIGTSYLKVIVFREFDVNEHEIIKHAIGKWRGQGICYLKKGIRAESVQKSISNTPRNMLYFLTSKKITDEDVKLLSTQIVLYQKVCRGITMSRPTKEIAQWRSIFVLYAITCFGINNCTADKGHKIFFKLPLIKKVELKGELIQRPWFFQSLESLKFIEERTQLFRNESSGMTWTYDIFQTLRRMELKCSIDTLVLIKLPTNLEILRVELDQNNELKKEWKINHINLKELRIANMLKKDEIILPTTLNRLSIKNINDTYYDFYRLFRYTQLTRIKMSQCHDIPRLLVPSSVQILNIDSCDLLREIYQIEQLTCLRDLILKDCQQLILPSIPSSLSKFSVQYCDKLTAISFTLNPMLKKVNVVANLNQIQLNESLEKLHIASTTNLTTLDISNLDNLKELALHCEITHLSYPSNLTKLEINNINNIDVIESLPDKSLRYLVLNNITLRNGLIVPTSLVSLKIKQSSIPNLFALKNCHHLTSIKIIDCLNISTLSIPFNVLSCKLFNLPSLTGLIHLPNSQILSLQIVHCSSLEVLQTPFSLRSLLCVHCYNLASFLNLNISKLFYLNIQNTSKLKFIQLPPSISSLILNSCYSLSSIAGLDALLNCFYLKITHCPSLSSCAFPHSIRLFEIAYNAFDITY